MVVLSWYCFDALRRQLAEEQFVQRILAFIPMAVSKIGQEGTECLHFLLWYLQADQNAADIAALIAVMEQADIPVGIHVAEKAHQCARAFREFKAVQQLVLCQSTLAADQMADVHLGQFIMGQVERGETLLPESLGDLGRFVSAGSLDANEDM